MSTPQTLTSNSHLQEQLQIWDSQLQQIVATTDLSGKQQQLDQFVRGFVPLDVTEEDILYYENNLLQDDEFFEALVREIHQCCTGERVEEIKGDQKKKATYILLPPPDAGRHLFSISFFPSYDMPIVSDGSSLDIVRELSFIAVNREGNQWRAEVKHQSTSINYLRFFFNIFSLITIGIKMYSFYRYKKNYEKKRIATKLVS